MRLKIPRTGSGRWEGAGGWSWKAPREDEGEAGDPRGRVSPVPAVPAALRAGTGSGAAPDPRAGRGPPGRRWQRSAAAARSVGRGVRGRSGAMTLFGSGGTGWRCEYWPDPAPRPPRGPLPPRDRLSSPTPSQGDALAPGCSPGAGMLARHWDARPAPAAVTEAGVPPCSLLVPLRFPTPGTASPGEPATAVPVPPRGWMVSQYPGCLVLFMPSSLGQEYPPSTGMSPCQNSSTPLASGLEYPLSTGMPLAILS